MSPPIMSSALDAIGNTPLIRLDRLAASEGLKCNLLAKVEFFNAGGSVKDRIAKRMVEMAERDGVLKPDSVVIEPTSGNTGIGLALACAIKGYPVIITLPAKMSLEKEVTLRALGAEIVRTPTEAASESDESNIGVARALQKQIPGGVILDQYGNPNNPAAHEFGTGAEIVDQVTRAASEHGGTPSSGLVDVLVASTGTGGTITGCSKAVKKHNAHSVVLGVDPKGSILAQPESLNALNPNDSGAYLVEGIGYDFIPGALDRSTVDTWIKTTDEEAFAMTVRIMRSEGLLIGGSSGSTVAGAIRWLKSEVGMRDFGSVEGKNVVVVLADGIRNYMSKPWFREELDRSGKSKMGETIERALGRPMGLPPKLVQGA